MEKEKDMKPERLPFKPGSTPMQPHEMPQKSIKEIAEEVKAKESVKKIKKLLLDNPPLGPELPKERDRRLGERE